MVQFTEYGIEGVVPLELLPSDVRSKYQAKPSERSKRAKKDETKGAAQQAEENQVLPTNHNVLTFLMHFRGSIPFKIFLFKWEFESNLSHLLLWCSQ